MFPHAEAVNGAPETEAEISHYLRQSSIRTRQEQERLLRQAKKSSTSQLVLNDQRIGSTSSDSNSDFSSSSKSPKDSGITVKRLHRATKSDVTPSLVRKLSHEDIRSSLMLGKKNSADPEDLDYAKKVSQTTFELEKKKKTLQAQESPDDEIVQRAKEISLVETKIPTEEEVDETILQLSIRDNHMSVDPTELEEAMRMSLMPENSADMDEDLAKAIEQSLNSPQLTPKKIALENAALERALRESLKECITDKDMFDEEELSLAIKASLNDDSRYKDNSECATNMMQAVRHSLRVQFNNRVDVANGVAIDLQNDDAYYGKGSRFSSGYTSAASSGRFETPSISPSYSKRPPLPPTQHKRSPKGSAIVETVNSIPAFNEDYFKQKLEDELRKYQDNVSSRY